MSSNLSAVTKALYTYFNTEWADTTPICWPNASFIAPTDEPWIDVRISWGDGEGVSMAPTNRNTLVGVLYVNCYCVEDEGQGEMMDVSDQVRDLFNRIEVAGF